MSAQRDLTSLSGGFEPLGMGKIARDSGLQPSHSRRTMSIAATAAYDQSVDVFPSLIIGANGSIEPQGSFAEAQAQVSWQEIAFFCSPCGESRVSLAQQDPFPFVPNKNFMQTFFDLFSCCSFLFRLVSRA